MLTLFLQALLVIFVSVTLVWILSVIITNASIVDLFWGVGFVIVNAIYFFNSGEMYTRKVLLLVLVSLWGLRLFAYLSWRNIGKGEDFRYQEFRRTYGAKRYWWFSYFQVFLLQGILILFVSLPLLGVHSHTGSDGFNLVRLFWVLWYLLSVLFLKPEAISNWQGLRKTQTTKEKF